MNTLIQSLNDLLRYAAEQEEKSFHQALHDNPRDYTPLLIYADWLQENGHEGKARVIRAHAESNPIHDRLYDSPDHTAQRAESLAQTRTEIRQMRMDRDRVMGRTFDPDNYPEAIDINWPQYSINGDHVGANNLNSLTGGLEHSASVGKNVGGTRSLHVVARSKVDPDRWFHWGAHFLPAAQAEEVARQLHADGVPVRQEHGAEPVDFM